MMWLRLGYEWEVVRNYQVPRVVEGKQKNLLTDWLLGFGPEPKWQ